MRSFLSNSSLNIRAYVHIYIYIYKKYENSSRTIFLPIFRVLYIFYVSRGRIEKKKKEKRKLIRSSGTDNNCVSFPLSSLYRVDFYINTPRRGYERASHRARLVSIRLALGTRCEVTAGFSLQIVSQPINEASAAYPCDARARPKAPALTRSLHPVFMNPVRRISRQLLHHASHTHTHTHVYFFSSAITLIRSLKIEEWRGIWKERRHFSKNLSNLKKREREKLIATNIHSLFLSRRSKPRFQEIGRFEAETREDRMIGGPGGGGGGEGRKEGREEVDVAQ